MIYKIKYTGKLISNNQFYSGLHWAVRNKIKNEYREVFSDLLLTNRVSAFEKFDLTMRYNSRHDCDNLIATVKLFVDTL